MDKHLLEQIANLDAFEPLDRGGRGIRVSLQTPEALPPGTRAERRACLQERFSELANALGPQGARVELDTLSVSAQSVEAVLPVDHYDDLKHNLEHDGIRVDPVIERNIV